jgi:orotate phosphoribosyltransferase
MSKQEIQSLREELLEMIKRDAYVKGKITLSSGKQSDYYIDARRVTLCPRGAYLCARLILDHLKDNPVDAIGGPTLGADPMIGAVGVIGMRQGQDFSTFIIRKAPKAHGQQKQVEGPLLQEGQRVVIIDDVATTGKAFLQSLDVLDHMRISVDQAICIVDRGEGAKQALAARGCELMSLFDIGEIHQ